MLAFSARLAVALSSTSSLSRMKVGGSMGTPVPVGEAAYVCFWKSTPPFVESGVIASARPPFVALSRSSRTLAECGLKLLKCRRGLTSTDFCSTCTSPCK